MSSDFVLTTLETLNEALNGTQYPTITFLVDKNALTIQAFSNLRNGDKNKNLPQQIAIQSKDFESIINWGDEVVELSNETNSFPEISEFASNLGFNAISFLPITNKTDSYAFVMVGSYPDQKLTASALKSYINIIQLANTVIDQSNLLEQDKDDRVAELKTLTAINNAISTPWDTTTFFSALHDQIKQEVGDHAFIGAIYDEQTASIQIPYMHEEGEMRQLESFPLGEGLTSILLRNKKPLLIMEDAEEQTKKLGAKVVGKPAKSWMGAPMMVDNKAIGALILQDLENEKAFNQSHLQYLDSLAKQVSKIVYNAQSLDDARKQNTKIQAAAEIARDISSALNLDELLLKAVNLIRERFNFYHAGVFLVDHAGNNVIIREATGEAGAQMKRLGHKHAIGSKSTVGFVAGQGEQLVINDISKDVTHKHNPLLPDTKAEVAIPMKIGERIVGVLDIQSTVPYSFNPNDLNTFQVLADQLAIAVNNTELFAETQEHLSQHRLLHHITTSAASGTTLDEALTSTVKGLQVTLGGDRVSILLSDDERKNLTIKAWVGYSEESTDLVVPFNSGITGWVAAHRKPLRISDVTKDARYIQVSANTRSELALPLIFRNEILGVLNIESEQVAAYTDNDEEMLGTLAGSLAAIIANARLVEQIRKQAERERMLYEITSKIRRSTDMQTILSTTISELSRVTGARRTQITVGITPEDQTEEQASGRTVESE